MIYPENFQYKIGFDKIAELLEQHCLSDAGKQHIASISFETSHGKVQQLLSQAEEFRQILLSGKSFPGSGYFDLRPELRRIQLKGTFIDLEMLFDLKSSLHTINSCLQYFEEADEGMYPELNLLVEGIEMQLELVSAIERIVDDRGMVRDSASPELKEIRSKLRRKQLSIDGRIRKSMQEAKKAGLVPDDAEITIRNGRTVIPVLSSGKRQLKGFIHDESATGQTVFIEPTEVFDLNNEIRELENAERREIINILLAFTDQLRPQTESLIHAYFFLGEIDFIRAKARLALKINGIKPILKPTTIMSWRNARHPLLFLSHQEQGKTVIPMDLELNKKDRILVISGPNAGGKSVCLKTAGLLQYMLQCGLLVPMEENSETGIFKDIFLDIGDEQSLENDLSTYSSHLINIREFIKHCSRNSLFLIDEFGTGTEPHLGGAIAEAALHTLNKEKAFGLVTTHYANIKLMADSEAGIINGAMLYDTKEMQPLFILKTGKPGSSFAFEIARKIGFPEKVLEQATDITGYSQVDFEKQLQELETEKVHLEKEREQFGVADTFLSEMIGKYENLIADLNDRKTEILENARREAADILSGANRLIEKTIKDIRETEAEKEKTKALRKKMKEDAAKIIKTENQTPKAKEQRPKNDDREPKNEHPPKTKKFKTKNSKLKTQAKSPDIKYLSGTPKVGDQVEIIPYGSTGEILEIKGRKAKVSSGNISIEVNLSDLKIVSGRRSPVTSSRKAGGYSGIMNDINQRAANFSPNIDLRGKRALEALDELKTYIDNAILLSVKEVSILHGKGDGILRNVIREYLQTIDEIEHFGDEHVDRGGQGITIVKMR